MGIEVRRIHSTDGALLATLRLAALRDAPAAFGSSYAVEAAFTEAQWDDRARRAASGAESATFFACDGARPVGLVGAYRREVGDGGVELVSMWTHPRARHRGAARALLRAVIDWASATGADAVALWVTRGNVAAQTLYESVGFSETGEHQPLPSDPCKDEVRMVLAL